MKNIKAYSSILFFFTLQALAASPPESQTFEQWFTGPLLTPLAITPDPSHPGIEVTFGVKNTYGIYSKNWKAKNTPNTWSFYNYIDFQAGLNSFIGIEFLGSWISNKKQGQQSTRLQDTVLRVGFQVINTEKTGSLMPNFRIIIQETVPTGQYQNLNPKKGGVDSTGLGSYQTGIFFAFQKLYYISNYHKFQTRFSLGYFLPSKVNVRNFNSYGGGLGTKGTVSPGSYFTFYLSGEYNLNDRWAIGFDSNYQQNFPGSFSGRRGADSEQMPAKIFVSSSAQLSLAPELEFTFTENSGMLLGYWFSVIGKNTPAFGSFFVAFLHVF